jgi:hypothetical protein
MGALYPSVATIRFRSPTKKSRPARRIRPDWRQRAIVELTSAVRDREERRVAAHAIEPPKRPALARAGRFFKGLLI